MAIEWNKKSGLIVSLLLFVAVFLFWLIGYPQAMNYQEQNQLFLFSCDYFAERMALPGGLADWLGEFLVQFYYVPWLGALVQALLAVVLQRLTNDYLANWSNRSNQTNWPNQSNWTTAILSVLPVMILIGVMGDENVLLSYPLAIIGALTFAVCLRRARWWCDFVVVPVLYWLIGPMAMLYVLLRIIHNWRREWWSIIWLLAVEMFVYAFIVKEYPLTEVILGINYYRIPLVLLMPKTLWIAPLAVCLLGLAAMLLNLNDSASKVISSCLLTLAAASLAFTFGFDKDKYELMMQDYLVRNGKWQEIVDRAQDYQVRTAFSSNAVNLALAMTNQLAARQFEFYQSGEDALIMPMVRDNMSNLPTAEAFYRLGMVNSAKRYMYDIQESIINGRKSGRCMKRIAECFIINGQYQIARKYIDVLKQSLFYRSWAKYAESCLYNETKVNANPEWGRIRRERFKNDFLYSYPEIDKMLGQLFVRNPQNKMALDYFMGEMLLKGDVQGFMHYLGWAQRYGGYTQMPYGYQDAVRCIQSHGTAPGSAYGTYVKRMISSTPSSSQGGGV